MTIKELYEWALENNCEDFKLYKTDDWGESITDVNPAHFEIYKDEKTVVI